MNQYEKTAEGLLSFIKKAASPYHVVETTAENLKEAGFTELDFTKEWTLHKGKAYYTKPYGTTLFSFAVGKDAGEDSWFKIAAAHTDYPCFRIKPKADMKEGKYYKLDVESYGGLILNSWQDRPLSIAGKVCLKSQELFAPETRLVDFKRPVGTIPCLAIHMNREVNKGIELKKQKDLLPLIAMGKEKEDGGEEGFSYLKNCLAKELSVEAADILDFDLYVYNCEAGDVIGMERDFISSPRLDNLTSVYALLHGMKAGYGKIQNQDAGISIAAFYDNEEIGSRSKQGADSMLTNILLEKIYAGLSMDRVKLCNAIMKSFLLSVDVAHCLHPNYPDKNDPVSRSYLNDGIVLKIDSTQKYAYDTEAIASIMQLCERYKIPFQKFTNHSDETSGSTLGSLASSWMPMKTVDLGVPLLAMHAARETMGIKDQETLNQLLEVFFCQ